MSPHRVRREKYFVKSCVYFGYTLQLKLKIEP